MAAANTPDVASVEYELSDGMMLLLTVDGQIDRTREDAKMHGCDASALRIAAKTEQSTCISGLAPTTSTSTTRDSRVSPSLV